VSSVNSLGDFWTPNAAHVSLWNLESHPTKLRKNHRSYGFDGLWGEVGMAYEFLMRPVGEAAKGIDEQIENLH
jgi:hypothetical protein